MSSRRLTAPWESVTLRKPSSHEAKVRGPTAGSLADIQRPNSPSSTASAPRSLLNWKRSVEDAELRHLTDQRRCLGDDHLESARAQRLAGLQVTAARTASEACRRCHSLRTDRRDTRHPRHSVADGVFLVDAIRDADRAFQELRTRRRASEDNRDATQKA